MHIYAYEEISCFFLSGQVINISGAGAMSLNSLTFRLPSVKWVQYFLIKSLNESIHLAWLVYINT